MHIALTQLQGYNTMFKLMDSFAQKINSDDLLGLLGDMCFISDGSTADSAMWEDWLEAINNKNTLTKQEAFDGMIYFLQTYRNLTSSLDTAKLIDQIQSAKNCNDTTIPIVKQWNLYLKETLQEPEGTKEYLKLTK